MKTKQKIILAVLVLLALGLAGLGVYMFMPSAKQTPPILASFPTDLASYTYDVPDEHKALLFEDIVLKQFPVGTSQSILLEDLEAQGFEYHTPDGNSDHGELDYHYNGYGFRIKWEVDSQGIITDLHASVYKESLWFGA